MGKRTSGNQKEKNIILIAVIVVLGVLTVGSLLFYQWQTSEFLKSTSSSITYERHYAFVGDRSSSFLQSVYEAAYQTGVDNGDYVEFTGEDLESNYSTSTLMKIAMASDVDGIIVNADNNNELIEEINAANEQGIPVVCIGTENYGSERKTFIGISNYTLGQAYGKMIAERATSQKQDVLILKSSDERVSSQNLVVSGMIDCVGKEGLADKFSFASQTAGDGTMFSAAESVTDIFAEKDLPSILVCLDETTTTAACQAIVDSNHVGDIMVLGFYMNETIQSAIEKSILDATVTVSPVLFGSNAVSCLDTYIEDGFVTEYVPIDIETVTQANIRDYLRKEAAASEEGGAADE